MAMIGKYSPTVSEPYAKDPQWFRHNCQHDASCGDATTCYHMFDKDGYDSYGYNAQGLDRAGKNEHFYRSQYQEVLED